MSSSYKIAYSQAYTVVLGVGFSTVVPANRRKGQTQKDVHLEESNTNDPQFPESVSCHKKTFSVQWFQLIYQDNTIMFNFSHGLLLRCHILVSVFK